MDTRGEGVGLIGGTTINGIASPEVQEEKDNFFIEEEEKFFSVFETMPLDEMRRHLEIFEVHGLWYSPIVDVCWLLLSIPLILLLQIIGTLANGLVHYCFYFAALIMIFGNARLLMHICVIGDLFIYKLLNHRQNIPRNESGIATMHSVLTPITAKSIANLHRLDQYFDPKKKVGDPITRKDYFLVFVEFFLVMISSIQTITTAVPPHIEGENNDSSSTFVEILSKLHLIFLLNLQDKWKISFYFSFGVACAIFFLGAILFGMGLKTGDPQILRTTMVLSPALIYCDYTQQLLDEKVEHLTFPSFFSAMIKVCVCRFE